MDNPAFNKETDGEAGTGETGTGETAATSNATSASAGDGPSTAGSASATSSTSTGPSTATSTSTGDTGVDDTGFGTTSSGGVGSTTGIGSTTDVPPPMCGPFDGEPLALGLSPFDELGIQCGGTYTFSGEVSEIDVNNKFWKIDVCPDPNFPCGDGCPDALVTATVSFDGWLDEAHPWPVDPWQCVQVVVDMAAEPGCHVDGMTIYRMSGGTPPSVDEHPWYIGQSNAPDGATPYVNTKGWAPGVLLDEPCDCWDPQNLGCCNMAFQPGSYALKFSAFGLGDLLFPGDVSDGMLGQTWFQVANLASHQDNACPAEKVVSWTARRAP